MRIDYKRKLTKQELTNLTTKLGAHESYGICKVNILLDGERF